MVDSKNNDGKWHAPTKPGEPDEPYGDEGGVKQDISAQPKNDTVENKHVSHSAEYPWANVKGGSAPVVSSHEPDIVPHRTEATDAAASEPTAHGSERLQAPGGFWAMLVAIRGRHGR